MRIKSGVRVVMVVAILCAFGARECDAQTKDLGWPNYGNDPGGARFSEAKQIDR